MTTIDRPLWLTPENDDPAATERAIRAAERQQRWIARRQEQRRLARARGEPVNYYRRPRLPTPRPAETRAARAQRALAAPKGRLTRAQRDLLALAAQGLTLAHIGRCVGIPWSTARNRVRRALQVAEGRSLPHGHRLGRRWTAAEDRYLWASWGKRPGRVIAAHLGRSTATVQRRASSRGLSHQPGTRAGAPPGSDWLSLQEAGRLVHWSPKWIRTWITAGVLPAQRAHRPGERRWWYIVRPEDVQAVARQKLAGVS